MALGTPIITTSVGGNAEVIDDQKTGIFVGYNDTTAIAEGILRLVRNPSFAEEITQNAKAKVKEFSDERMLDGLAAFLKQIK